MEPILKDTKFWVTPELTNFLPNLKHTYCNERLPEIDAHHENVIVSKEEPFAGGSGEDKQQQVHEEGEEGTKYCTHGYAFAGFFQLPWKWMTNSIS